MELSKLGLKCGGTPLDRAKRYWLLKDVEKLSDLPQKVFAKKQKKKNSSTVDDDDDTTQQQQVSTSTTTRRVDLARQEAVVNALLDRVRPMLEATIRRLERRQTQTGKERDVELEQDLYGSDILLSSSQGDGTSNGTKRKKRKTLGNNNDDDDDSSDDDDSDDDDEDTPIYNPKGVPLGWDGKPIPYWLFKLHGLNHFYACEICGGESYRGRRNFEKHFAEAKHAHGMRCLGIPNTQHFHGVTTIQDAQELWEKLNNNLQENQFDGSKQEEYEDSHGNVMSRATYEDLARQGLL